MTSKEIAVVSERNNLIRGYVYPYERSRKEYWFEVSPINIANFIMQHHNARGIIRTDALDRLILNTVGEFIDRCPDQEFLQQILSDLIPMQMGEIEPQEVSTATDKEVEVLFECTVEMR